MHETRRSGYAQDIMPGLVGTDESTGSTLPRADEKGNQDGKSRLSPVEMGQRPFKVVTMEEAQANMTGRLKGKIPPIGQRRVLPDEPVSTDKHKRKGKGKGRPMVKASTADEEQNIRRQPMPAKTQPVNNVDNFDPLGGEYAPEYEPEPGSPELAAEEAALEAEKLGAHNKVLSDRVFNVSSVLDATSTPAINRAGPSELDMWLAQRGRVTLTLSDGTFTMPCVAVKECPLGLTVLLPLNPDGSTFIPKPGVAVTIGYKDKQWTCYFPGVYCEVPELKLVMLMFIRAEE